MHQALLDLWVLTWLHPVTMGVFYAIGAFFIFVAVQILRRR